MSQPNLLFVFADQWRRHAVGVMGEDPVVTPNMDRFANQGALFTNACACSPVCTPSRASMLAGKHPFTLNMMHNWLQFPAHEPSIARILAGHGYDTGYIGKWHLDAMQPGDLENIWNIYTPPGPRRQGFDFWYAHGCNHSHFLHKYMTTNGSLVAGDGWQIDHETDIAIDYIKATGAVRQMNRPFCLFLSWSPPHSIHGGPGHDPKIKGLQYKAPDHLESPYRRNDLPVRRNADRERYLKAAPGYFGAVASMDQNFGRLLACLDEQGLADDTIVVLTSDHGEHLGSHGLFGKDTWFEESIGIPFLMRYPGKVPAGWRQTGQFSTVDFLPTLLGLMDLPGPDNPHGRDFSADLRHGRSPAIEDLFLAYNSGSPYGLVPHPYPYEPGRKWRAVRTPRYTYATIDAGAESQYHDPSRFACPLPRLANAVLLDRSADPLEQRPIFRGDGHDDLMDQLHGRLAAWLTELGDNFLDREWLGVPEPTSRLLTRS